MAQFDVYRGVGTKSLLLDCQSDLLSDLQTRFLIPLLPVTSSSKASRLNPVLSIGGERYLLAPQLALSAPIDRLGAKVGSLASNHYEIVRAIDVLLGGV